MIRIGHVSKTFREKKTEVRALQDVIPWTKEPSGLQSMGHRVRYD